ncbi:MAG TPA: LysM domain-containing protein, partial [Caldimonas sp.]|nr:LysM domain-containing protein [Caldimonas sp.]
MSRRSLFAPSTRSRLTPRLAAGLAALGLTAVALAATPRYPVTEAQRATARRTAEAGVPLSEIKADAPDVYTVKHHDTLWGISGMYLKSPWRWPELWGMNLDEVKNPNLIYPGQTLYLDKSNGRARLRMGEMAGGPVGETRLSPRVRATDIALQGISSIPFNLIEPFLNEAVIFEGNELASAPRIVATQEGRVLLSRGDTAYVRGDVSNASEFRIFRQARPLHDPLTKEI